LVAKKTWWHEGFTKIIELIFISLCFLVSWCLGGKKNLVAKKAFRSRFIINKKSGCARNFILLSMVFLFDHIR
jgi:hypothetical protein